MAKIAHWLFDQKHKGEKLLFSSFILFLPTQLGKHFWPSFSYLLGIRSDYLSPTVYFTDVLFVVSFVSVVSMFFSWIRNFHVIPRKKLIPFLLIPVGVFIYLLITILLSSNIGLGMYGLWKFIECFFLAWYIARRSAEILSFSQICFLLSIGGIFESLLAIAQFINQGSLNGLFYLFGERSFTSQTIGIANMSLNGTELLRPYSTFSHPNVLAGYLLIISTLMLFAFWKKYKPFPLSHFYYLGIFFLCTFALFITYSRVAILCWILSISAFVFFQLKKKEKIATVCLGLLVICLLVFAAWHLQLFDRFSSLTFTDESVTQREVLLSASWQLFINHPLFGVGFHNFLPALATLPMLQLNFFLLQPVHNIFALVGVETGLIGLFGFIVLLINRLMFHVRNIKAKTIASFSVLCLTLLLQIIITGMFDHYWLTLQQGQLLFAFVLGLSWYKYLPEK